MRTGVVEPGLSCREMVELVTDYLEGALNPADAARFEAHLVACGACAAYLEQMRITIRATGALTEADLPPEAADALIAAFRTWRTAQP